ncbi:uncharacterized protein LOC142830474 [Pelodiscus sinensis]|uniref:uncharacterized protein LOC142830474 n=1 Tax=Pelodiscus sinensis TaxID=13735 RepID=UPI003F6C7DAB
MEQVWAKVKELRQGYMKARSSTTSLLGGEPSSPSIVVDSGLEQPILQCPEPVPEMVGQVQPPEEEEDEQDIGTVTLSQEPVPASLDVSQASEEAWEGTSARPAGTEGPATLPLQAPPGAWTSCRRARPGEELMHQPIRVMRDIHSTLSHQPNADLEWRQQAWSDPMARCNTPVYILSRPGEQTPALTAPTFPPSMAHSSAHPAMPLLPLHVMPLLPPFPMAMPVPPVMHMAPPMAPPLPTLACSSRPLPPPSTLGPPELLNPNNMPAPRGLSSLAQSSSQSSSPPSVMMPPSHFTQPPPPDHPHFC